MCGINLAIQFPGADFSSLQRMMLATQHRGPDLSCCEKVADGIFVAANRLGILDLSTEASMPFWSVDRKQVLAWNGAIYNHAQLKEQLLQQGITFRTHSDTETLLYWLKIFGEKRLSELHGMFALVFIDLEEKLVILARDYSGEKPLFFYKKGNGWLFSSETRGIQAGLDEKVPVDKSGIPHHCWNRHPLPGKTLLHGIQQVQPGSALILDLEGKLIHQKNWNFPPPLLSSNLDEQFESILGQVTNQTLDTEVPLGMVLSGGADSSLLLAVAHEQGKLPTHTYTLCLEGKYRKKYADPLFSEEIRKKYPTDHRDILMNRDLLMQNWEEYIANLDQPVGDSASFLTWWIAKQAKQEVRILVSGAGADELFGGYNRHEAFKFYLKHPILSRLLRKGKDFLPQGTALEKFAASMDKSPEATFIQMSALGRIPAKSIEAYLQLYPNGPDSFKNALEWDRTCYLCEDVLKIHDLACSAHGIEGRSPYLHPQLLAWSKAIPEEVFLREKGKIWIKKALTKRNLGHIAQRKKLGFGLPLHEWMEEKEFRDWINAYIKNMDKYWHEAFPKELRVYLEKPEKLEKNRFLLTWNLFLLASWLNKQEK